MKNIFILKLSNFWGFWQTSKR